MAKDILGYITCPTCGTAKGMRVSKDKNGDPFGFCEAECEQQMRVGGKRSRVRKFVENYPQFSEHFAERVASSVGEVTPKPEAEKTPEIKPEIKPEPPAKPKSSGNPLMDFALGVRHD